MNKNKFLIFLLVIVIIFFSFSNYNAVSTIDESAYVIAMGIDSAPNGKINLSLQIAIPDSSSEGESSSSSEHSSSSVVNTVECNTVFSGITLINSYISKKLNLSYCKVAVFSEEIAKNGIGNYISDLMNDVELRPTCHILVSKCDAKYYLENSKPMLENLSSKYYEVQRSSEKNTGYTKSITILDFYNSYYDSFMQPYSILGNISGFNLEKKQNNKNDHPNNSEDLNYVVSVESETSEKVEKNIENLGLAVFRGDAFVGEISNIETIYHLMLSNQFKSSIINIPSPFSDNNYIALYISRVKSKNNVQIVNDSPYISCNIILSARVISSSVSNNYLEPENIKLLQDYSNSYLKTSIEDYLYKTSIDFKSDITGFGRYGVHNFNTIQSWNEYNWLEKYKNSFFDVNVNTKIISSYLVYGDRKN